MPGPIERIEAGGHESDLRVILDEVEALHEDTLRRTRGRAARAEIIRRIKTETLERFAAMHPSVKVRFLSGSYRDADVPEGQTGRRR